MRVGWLVSVLSAAGGVAVADELYVVPPGVETRWASPENPRGERGQGGQENGGRKGAAFFVLEAGESRTIDASEAAPAAARTARHARLTADGGSDQMAEAARQTEHDQAEYQDAGQSHRRAQ